MFISNLKEMIRLSIIGFIALVMMGIVMSLYSCGSHKSAVMKETFVQREDSTKQSIDFGFTAIQDISNFFHSTTNRKINYDTSKPIDSKTGKHPLLAEGDTEENNKIEQETNVVSVDSFSLQSDSASFSRSQENDKQNIIKQKDETTVPKQISGVIWTSCILLLLMIAAWIIYKTRKGG